MIEALAALTLIGSIPLLIVVFVLSGKEARRQLAAEDRESCGKVRLGIVGFVGTQTIVVATLIELETRGVILESLHEELIATVIMSGLIGAGIVGAISALLYARMGRSSPPHKVSEQGTR